MQHGRTCLRTLLSHSWCTKCPHVADFRSTKGEIPEKARRCLAEISTACLENIHFLMAHLARTFVLLVAAHESYFQENKEWLLRGIEQRIRFELQMKSPWNQSSELTPEANVSQVTQKAGLVSNLGRRAKTNKKLAERKQAYFTVKTKRLTHFAQRIKMDWTPSL